MPFKRAKDFLSRRRQAYARVFDDGNADAGRVLEDLMQFCRFGQTAFHPDQRVTDVLIGRQEVLYRILDHARLDTDVLFQKYNITSHSPRARAFKMETDDDVE
ncbi:MAG: hypothetical protein Q8P46_06950 [Hyphomicrobiales bacterium]|nr:hypothetical protein [Hyphomicrobiales bacterium]